MSVLSTVAGRVPELSASEAAVGRFLLDQPHRVGHTSAARIAAEVGVSDATVIRAVRRLGFAGLGSLREALAEELSPRGRLGNTLTRTSADGGASSLVGELIRQRVDAVAALTGRIEAESLDAAVEVLERSARIGVCAFGPAGHLARYGAHQLRRVGRPAFALGSSGSDFADELLDLQAGDAIVLLSYDGRDREVAALYAQAAEVGAPVVLITEPFGAPDRRAAVVLPAGRGALGTFVTHSATVAVLESLAVATAAAQPQRADAAARRLGELRALVAAGRGNEHR